MRIFLPYHPRRIAVTKKQRELFVDFLRAANPIEEYYIPTDITIEIMGGRRFRTLMTLINKGLKVEQVLKENINGEVSELQFYRLVDADKFNFNQYSRSTL